jgi:Cytochrome c7 and related cytochrome c
MKNGRSTRSLAVVIAAAVVGGAAGVRATAPPAPAVPSPLIYPAQEIPLRFDHALHARLGARCEGCHTEASSSRVAADNLIPGEAACRSCHAVDRTQPTRAAPAGKGAARCDACHVGGGDGDDGAGGAGGGWMPAAGQAEPPRVRLATPNLKFNHQQHAARGIGCEVCHAGVATRGAATRADLPLMAVCLSCHTGKVDRRGKDGDGPPQATSRCGACHLTEADGRLKVALASAATAATGLPGATGPLVPSGSLRGLDAHGPTFRRDHAQAGREESYCLGCHRRSECMDCHGGVVRPPDIHPSDYVSLHGNDARRNTPDCGSCHRNQTFCVGCHQRTGVAPDPEGGLPGQKPQNPFGTGTGLKHFHPPGWVRDSSGGVIGAPTSSSHSLAAKRNIRACASCHREESCLTCHSADPTRSIGVSPHGPHFGATARCKFMAARNKRACLKCHALTSPELDCESAPP